MDSSSANQTRSRHSRPADPVDPEREAEAIRSKEGGPLLKPVGEDLLEISEKTGVPFEISQAT